MRIEYNITKQYPKLATTTTHTSLGESPGPQDTERHKHGNVINIDISSPQSCHRKRRKGDRPAGPFFLFFLLLLRWLSWEKASAAFCSRDTKISMSSRAQLSICWGSISEHIALQAWHQLWCNDTHTDLLTTSFSMRCASFSCESGSLCPWARLSTFKHTQKNESNLRANT